MTVTLRHKLRVALVTRYPYVDSDAYSGLVQVSLRLCDALARRDDVELVVLSRAYQPQAIERRQVGNYQVVFLPYAAQVLRNPTFYFGAAAALSHELRRLKPDIVHCQVTPETAIGSLLSGLPLVSTIHGIYAAEAESASSLRARIAFPIIKAIESWYVRRMRHIMSGTPYVFRFVQARNPHAKLYNISNPIDPAFFAGDVRANRPDPQSILQLGTIYPRKGLDLTIEALHQLRRFFPRLRLTVAGNEVDKEFIGAVRSKIVAYDLAKQVRWLGPISQEQLIGEMRSHQIICLPSREDTLPMVLSQAMAIGNLCVASDAGGIPDMIAHGRQGILFPRDNARALAQALAVALQLSPERSEEIRLANRAYAEQTYHDDGIAAQTVAAYRQILAG